MTIRTASRLPRLGSLPKPASHDAAKEALGSEAFSAPSVNGITLTTVEFTSLCPRTGQPDFGSVAIEYVPRRLCLESRSLKYYLWSYRDRMAFCETIDARIADDIAAAIGPESLTVRVSQNIRGGIASTSTAQRSSVTRRKS